MGWRTRRWPESTSIFSTKGEGAWYLQQANYPAHKRVAFEVVMGYNNKHGTSIHLLGRWPPGSTGLTPIGDIWGIVQHNGHERGRDKP